MAGKSTISITFKLDADGKGFKAIAQDANGLRTVMASTLEQSEELKKSLINWSAAVQGLQSVDRAVNQICSQLNAITSESEGFTKAMKEANTMAGKDSAGFKQLKGEVADLAKDIPIARDLLANGLYQTISNGVPENNWIEFLNISARSAVGGLADINKVVGVTSTVIKNYGLEWSAAADIQDKIQLTAKNGVTSFEQLAQALPRVTGNAATLGVSIDELMGTFATLTGVSGNTAEVSTQLAAIFTSLVKPSSEAADMANKMGIQFNAAAIKAAGGFQNFLNNLNSSVKAYAQANGVLEQEVYGKLFGSAEAIRALIPLQGELADKFEENVANMVNSAGTMDAAYADMSSHGEAVTQMLRNQWATVIDVVSGVTSAVQPYANFAAGLLSTMSSAAILVVTFKQLNVQQMILTARAKIAGLAMATLGLRGKSASAVMRFFSSALKGGAYSATAFKRALCGLLIASGVGVAIVAITEIINHLVGCTDKATESVEKLDDATDDYKQAAADAKMQIENDIKALGDLIKAKKDTKDAVQHLNKAYGEIFGTYKTAEEWYKILTDKSQLYIKQIGYEAQAKSLAAKIAENAINRELAAEKKAEWEQNNKSKMRRGRKDIVTGLTEFISSDEEWKTLDSELKKIESDGKSLQHTLDIVCKKLESVDAEMNTGLTRANTKIKISELNWQQCADAIEANNKALKVTTDPKRINELKAQNAQLEARQKLLNIDNKSKKRKAEKGSIKYIEERISKIKTEIEYTVDRKSRKELYDELRKLETEKFVIEFEYKGGIAQNFDKMVREQYSDQVMGKATKEPNKIPELATPVTPDSDLVERAEKMKKLNEQLTLGRDLTGGMADAFNTLGGAIKGATGEWLNYVGAFFDNASRLLAAIFAITSGEAMKSAAQTPIIGWLQVGAAAAAVAASFASLPKFANGGIISGPTVGLMGEYAGASNNPEVVAPLDKLRGMLNPVGAPVIIGGTLRASGRELVCVLANETRIANKSGNRTNIKL